jgi:hypothetical protein
LKAITHEFLLVVIPVLSSGARPTWFCSSVSTLAADVADRNFETEAAKVSSA